MDENSDVYKWSENLDVYKWSENSDENWMFINGVKN